MVTDKLLAECKGGWYRMNTSNSNLRDGPHYESDPCMVKCPRKRRSRCELFSSVRMIPPRKMRCGESEWRGSIMWDN